MEDKHARSKPFACRCSGVVTLLAHPTSCRGDLTLFSRITNPPQTGSRRIFHDNSTVSKYAWLERNECYLLGGFTRIGLRGLILYSTTNFSKLKTPSSSSRSCMSSKTISVLSEPATSFGVRAECASSLSILTASGRLAVSSPVKLSISRGKIPRHQLDTRS